MSNNLSKATGSFDIARERAEADTSIAQEKNRLWWESLPMTYANWEADDRIPDDGEFADISKHLLDSNPWLGENFDFGRFCNFRVLEVGCGSGGASCLFALGGADVTAIDLTEAAVTLTRRSASAQGLEVDVRQMDAEHMDFADESFDYMFSWGVLHHSSNTEAAIGEVERVLRRGGSGLIMVYNRHSLRYYAKGLNWLLLKGKMLKGDNLSTVQRHYTDGFFHRHFSSGELRQVLSQCGLRPVRIAKTHMAKKMIPFIPSSLDEWLKSRYGWLLIAEVSRD